MGRQQGKSRPRSFVGKRTKWGDHHHCHSGVRDSAQVQKVRNEKIEIAFDTGEVYKHFKKSALQGCVPRKCSAEMTALGTESAETASWRNSRGSGRAGWRGGQWGCGLWAVLTGPRRAGAVACPLACAQASRVQARLLQMRLAGEGSEGRGRLSNSPKVRGTKRPNQESNQASWFQSLLLKSLLQSFPNPEPQVATL